MNNLKVVVAGDVEVLVQQLLLEYKAGYQSLHEVTDVSYADQPLYRAVVGKGGSYAYSLVLDEVHNMSDKEPNEIIRLLNEASIYGSKGEQAETPTSTQTEDVAIVVKKAVRKPRKQTN